MRLSTPPLPERRHLWTPVDRKGRFGRNVHAHVHALITPRCGHRKRLISAASLTLSTLSTPYIGNKYMSVETGVNGPFSERDRFQGKGVDTGRVDTPGLTPFLCAMMATPVDRLRKADTAKLAAKYGIRQDWAAWYLQMWVNRC